jgi:surfeit locus 1 family protein
MNIMRDRRREARITREQEAKRATKPYWHAPKPLAWVFIVASTALLFGLGFWQLERLEWKRGLISAIQNTATTRAIEGLPQDLDTLKTMGFVRIHLVGEYLHDYEIHLAARYYHSQLGYHILTPFQVQDGRTVLVNRGWVKADDKFSANRSDGQVKGVQSIIAMVRTDNDRSFFTPNPDVKDNVWFWRDVKAIRKATGLDLVPVTMDVLYDAPAGGKPLPSDGLIELRNDHLGYAITWFLVGITGIITFFFFHYRVATISAPQEKIYL